MCVPPAERRQRHQATPVVPWCGLGHCPPEETEGDPAFRLHQACTDLVNEGGPVPTSRSLLHPAAKCEMIFKNENLELKGAFSPGSGGDLAGLGN